MGGGTLEVAMGVECKDMGPSDRQAMVLHCVGVILHFSAYTP